MVSKLVERNGCYYCGNCRMKQSKLQEVCWWCESLFSNYEEILIKNIQSLNREENHNETNMF